MILSSTPTIPTEEVLEAIVETPPELPEVEEEPEDEKTTVGKLITQQYEEYLKNGARSTHGSLNLTLFSTHVEVVLNNIVKAVAIADFKEVLDSMMAISEKKMQSFQLPYGCFSFAADSTHMQLQMYYPAATKTLRYTSGDTDREYVVPFPNVIITQTLQKIKGSWKVGSTRYYCTEKTVPQLGDKFISGVDVENGIYLIPISNTYNEGNMCFGGNAMPLIFNENLRGLDYYYQFLFLSPFNSDLGIKALRTDGVRDWFAKWATLTEPPYEYLKARRY